MKLHASAVCLALAGSVWGADGFAARLNTCPAAARPQLLSCPRQHVCKPPPSRTSPSMAVHWGGLLGRRRRAPGASRMGGNPAAQVIQAGNSLKLGVLFLNLGGPEREEDVEPFLYNLFADPDIIRLPGPLRWLQRPIAAIISKRRAPKSKSAYESIGGGSPIVEWTNKQAEAVRGELQAKGLKDPHCYVAMRYWHPFTSEALARIKEDGVNALVIIPLYPQFSISTSGSSLRALNEEFTRDTHSWGSDKLVHTVVPSWYRRPGYIDALSGLVTDEVSKFTPAQRRQGVQVLFSAHGVPQSYVQAGDPYKAQIEDCVDVVSREVRHRLGIAPLGPRRRVRRGSTVKGAEGEEEEEEEEEGGAVSFALSYQSRVGPVEWLRPYTDDKIRELGEGGCENLVVVPISFVSEHIETLEEIDMEYRELAEESGVREWRRVPALNTDPRFIRDMADMVVDALAAPTLTVSEAFTLNNCDRQEQQWAQPLERLAQVGPATLAALGGVGLGRPSTGELAARLWGIMFVVDGLGRQLLATGN